VYTSKSNVLLFSASKPFLNVNVISGSLSTMRIRFANGVDIWCFSCSLVVVVID
jgi:hypothetical protein